MSLRSSDHIYRPEPATLGGTPKFKMVQAERLG